MVVAQVLPYFDPRTLSKLGGVTLRSRGTVEGSVTGAHRSPFHGFAAEFAEHREYTPGDDLRYVDWKVYGRSDRVFVKQFEEETNFACHLLLDASDSMRFQSDAVAMSKLEYAKHVAAAISYVVVKQQDAVGLWVFDEQNTQIVRPGSQPAHWKQLSHVLEAVQGDLNSESSATRASRVPPVWSLESGLSTLPRGVVILLSDLFDDMDAIMEGLHRLRHRKHDVRVWQIVDPAEEDFPFDDPTQFLGLEGWPDLSVEPRLLRDAYVREFQSHRQSLLRQCRSQRIDFQVLRTDWPIDAAVKQSLAVRS